MVVICKNKKTKATNSLLKKILKPLDLVINKDMSKVLLKKDQLIKGLIRNTMNAKLLLYLSNLTEIVM